MIHFLPGLQQTTQAASVGFSQPEPNRSSCLSLLIVSKKKLHPNLGIGGRKSEGKTPAFWVEIVPRMLMMIHVDSGLEKSIWTIGSNTSINGYPTYLPFPPLKWGLRTGLWWGAPHRKGQGSDQMSMMFTMRFRKIEKKTQPQRQRPAKTNASMQLVMWQQPTSTCFFCG